MIHKGVSRCRSQTLNMHCRLILSEIEHCAGGVKGFHEITVNL